MGNCRSMLKYESRKDIRAGEVAATFWDADTFRQVTKDGPSGRLQDGVCMLQSIYKVLTKICVHSVAERKPDRRFHSRAGSGSDASECRTDVTDICGSLGKGSPCTSRFFTCPPDRPGLLLKSAPLNMPLRTVNRSTYDSQTCRCSSSPGRLIESPTCPSCPQSRRRGRRTR